MKFEKLSSNRIKIVVSGDDLDLWGLSVRHIVQNTPEAQEIFWYIIRKAEVETGFSAGEARLMVEALPQKDAGIILFMTKLSEEAEDLERTHTNCFEEREIREAEKKEMMYRFSDFEDLLGAVSTLPESMESGLYEWDGDYYLWVRTPEEATPLSEYGVEMPHEGYWETYIREHGNPICRENAIRTMQAYFQ